MTIQQYIYEGHPESTAKTYLYYIEHFIAIHPKARDMTFKEVTDYFNELDKRGKSQGNRRVMLNAIKRYYDYVCDVLRHRDDHPCERIVLQGARSKDLMLNNIFTVDEMGMLLHREDRYKLIVNKNKLITSMLIYQGLASEEIASMKLSDINMDTGYFTARGTAKIRKRRLELKPMQVMLLMRYLQDRDSLLQRTGLVTDKLFVTHFGTEQTVDAVNRMFRPYKHLFPDKKLNPQNIRMSVIHGLVNESNLKLEVALERAGIKWMSSISKYLKADREGDLKIVQEMHPMKDL